MHDGTTLSESEFPPLNYLTQQTALNCNNTREVIGLFNTTHDTTTMKSHSENALCFSTFELKRNDHDHTTHQRPNFTRSRKCATYSSSYLQALFALSLLFCISTKCNAFSFMDSKHHFRLQSTRTKISNQNFPQTMWQRQSYDRCCSSTMLRMGKGDGKNKKKKKQRASSSPASSTPDVPGTAPLRVTSDSNVPVRRQLQWARMNKMFRTSGTAFRQSNVRRTSYRKSLGKWFICAF